MEASGNASHPKTVPTRSIPATPSATATFLDASSSLTSPRSYTRRIESSGYLADSEELEQSNISCFSRRRHDCYDQRQLHHRHLHRRHRDLHSSACISASTASSEEEEVERLQRDKQINACHENDVIRKTKRKIDEFIWPYQHQHQHRRYIHLKHPHKKRRSHRRKKTSLADYKIDDCSWIQRIYSNTPFSSSFFESNESTKKSTILLQPPPTKFLSACSTRSRMMTMVMTNDQLSKETAGTRREQVLGLATYLEGGAGAGAAIHQTLLTTAASKREYQEQVCGEGTEEGFSRQYNDNNGSYLHDNSMSMIKCFEDSQSVLPVDDENKENPTAATTLTTSYNSFSENFSDTEEEEIGGDDGEEEDGNEGDEKINKRTIKETEEEEEVFVGLVKVVSDLLHECHEVQATYRSTYGNVNN